MVCRTAITAENDILNTGKTSQRFHIRIVRLQRHRIREEKKIIYLAIHNAGSHLLITTQGTGFQNGKIPLNIRMLYHKSLKKKRYRKTSTVKHIPKKQIRNTQNPIDEVFLHGVVRHQSNLSN